MRTDDIILDENGEPYNPLAEKLAERNEEIKEKLKDDFEALLEEKKVCRALKSKEKFGGQFAIALGRVLRSYGMMPSQEVVNITYELIETYWNSFLDIISYYVIKIDFLPNKQMFQRYMGINERIYTQLKEHNDSDIRDLIASIDEEIYSYSCNGGESGNADGKAVLNRLTMHGVGHGLIKENEKQAIDKFGELPSMNEIDQEYVAVFGNPQKPKRLK